MWRDGGWKVATNLSGDLDGETEEPLLSNEPAALTALQDEC